MPGLGPGIHDLNTGAGREFVDPGTSPGMTVVVRERLLSQDALHDPSASFEARCRSHLRMRAFVTDIRTEGGVTGALHLIRGAVLPLPHPEV
ncbi:hypothetical protein C6569_02120 [Phreatobacter cathodiphilus]|uniref:Uncharacterized protein n=1 Tax=Phreatobacter cathodiphilus TaxID=1868589 RepID=A0A2S0N763_9HYPH|nr:hypothetical protein C6569_02120 [Phreatobacter cathodiphilus]